MKVLKINAGSENFEEFISDDFGAVSYPLNYHLKMKTYDEPVYSAKNDVIISAGSLTSLGIPGTYRLIISGRSPQITTFFMSTLGGGSIELVSTGFSALHITGKAKSRKIIIVRNVKGKLSVEFKNIKSIPDDTIKFQKYLIKNYSSKFKGLKYRCLVIGKASEHTNMGAIHSVQIVNNKINYGSEGWAGRGGMGSLLLGGHNVAGIVFGGDYEDEKLFNPDELFQKEFNKKMVNVIYDATEKYRYVKKLDTGGTYGVNFFSEGDRTLWFNWQSLKLDKKVRQKLYDGKIKNHFLKQFNDEIIEKKLFKTCGEACPAVCKKVWNKRTRDYEPSSSCGPQCGIFDMKHVHDFSGIVDDLGFDAIEIGNLVSYIFEGVSKGEFDKDDFLMNDKPVMNPDITLEDSRHNALIGIKLVEDIAKGELPVFNNGIRLANKELGFKDFAVYMSYGKEGVIAPNMYPVPGFLIPLPVQGKFHTYYGRDFLNPEEMGRVAVQRAVKELYSEELGICRFHRGWSEQLAPVLVKRLGLKKGLYEHCKDLFRKIIKYNELANAVPEYYETRRTKEILKYSLLYHLENKSDDKIALEWKSKFEENFEKAAREYWDGLRKGINEEVKK
ncbi:hypothetical protein COS64_00135 [archaeon CG06_land_8_20_14_3_00_37_11]|nr:MAG: hypothetical protein COS64_00135 [archaeon CG06_land_8_20_14_3_00_37_11]